MLKEKQIKCFGLQMCCRYTQYEHFALKVNSLLPEVGKDFDTEGWSLFVAYRMLLGLNLIYSCVLRLM